MENRTNITIVIPCYNNGHLLSQMIECILRQTLTSWKLVIVDDCSTDDTQKIIKEFVKRDNRINLLVRNREPKGAQTCRNIGMESAIGNFVVFFDADDLISTTCLEKRVAFLNSNPKVDYASFAAKAFTDEKKLPQFSDEGKKYGIGDDGTDILSDLLTANYSSIGWTNIYKITSLLNIKWDENVKIYQDFDFGVSICLSGLKCKFSNSNEIDYYYRMGYGETISSSFVSDEKCNSTIYLFSKILDKLRDCADYEKRKSEFIEYILKHFERIFISGSYKHLDIFIEFCDRYYGNSFAYRLKFIRNIALLAKDASFNKFLMYSLIMIFFWRKAATGLYFARLAKFFKKKMHISVVKNKISHQYE